MSEPGERTDPEREADRRIARARAAISSSFEELIDRGQRGVGQPRAPAPSAGRPAADLEAGSGTQPVAASSAASIDDIVTAVEQRISAWADARVQAAERRLELQSEAYAMALEEAEQRARPLADDTRGWAGGDIDEHLAAIDVRARGHRGDAALPPRCGLRPE